MEGGIYVFLKTDRCNRVVEMKSDSHQLLNNWTTLFFVHSTRISFTPDVRVY